MADILYYVLVMDSNKPNYCYSKIDPALNAFIIYRPKVRIIQRAVFHNQEVLKILSQCYFHTTTLPSKISSLCLKWERLLEKEISKLNKSGENNNSESCVIEFIRSNRRLYAVRGMLLLGHNSKKEQEKNYLFMLERVCHNKINLAMFFRKWNLSKREQDLVRLLLNYQGNKEIAHNLHLSINTVKGYLKMLMRKLSVTSRTGIIACFLNQELASSQLETSNIAE